MVDKGIIVLDWFVVEDDEILKKISLIMLFIFDLIGFVIDMVVICIEFLEWKFCLVVFNCCGYGGILLLIYCL